MQGLHVSVGSGVFPCSNPHSHLHCSLGVQGKYAEADLLYERSRAIREKVLGPEHPKVATMLNNRAVSLRAQVRDGMPIEVRLCGCCRAGLELEGCLQMMRCPTAGGRLNRLWLYVTMFQSSCSGEVREGAARGKAGPPYVREGIWAGASACGNSLQRSSLVHDGPGDAGSYMYSRIVFRS